MSKVQHFENLTPNERIENMDKQYKDWINRNAIGLVSILGKCQKWSRTMKEAFPELRLTNGEIKIENDKNLRHHWWLVDEGGQIVDPTEGQFHGGVQEYFEATDGSDCRIYSYHKCMECGTMYYFKSGSDRNFCSDPCADAMVASMNL